MSDRTFFTINQGIKSGFAEAGKNTYKSIVGKSGTIWLVSTAENEADNIYCSGGKNSQGFGGAVIEFVLDGGTSIKLQGPWHSNSDALFHDTGYDARSKHLTYGIIAKREIPAIGRYMASYYEGIIHKDSMPTIGSFDRIKNIAQHWADENGKECRYAVISHGGGSMGMATPIHKKGEL